MAPARLPILSGGPRDARPPRARHRHRGAGRLAPRALLLEQGTRWPASSGATLRLRGALAPLAGRVELVQANLLDQASLVAALRATGATEVYNLAAPSFVPRSWDEPVRTAEFAAVGATSLLEAIREVDPAIRFYQASSSEIFGEPRETPQTEETAPSPLTPYGVAKAYAHFITSSYRRHYGMFTCCGILYNHESPLRPVDFLPRKVSRAAAAISLGLEQELVLGDLSARRDWGYAGDYVRAMWLMLQHDEPGDYVVATGVSHSVEELVACAFGTCRARLARARPHRPVAVPRAGRAARPRRRRLEGPRTTLGWEPEVRFEELVAMLVGADVERLPRSGGDASA